MIKYEIIKAVKYSGLEKDSALEIIGIKPGRYYQWLKRLESDGWAALSDRLTQARVVPHRLRPEEETELISYALKYPDLRHKKLAHQIFRDTAHFYGPSTVYRVLKKYQLIKEWSRRPQAARRFENEPTRPNELWHVDITYIEAGITPKGRKIFWYLFSVLDSYSRYLISWELYPNMKKGHVKEILDAA